MGLQSRRLCLSQVGWEIEREAPALQEATEIKYIFVKNGGYDA